MKCEICNKEIIYNIKFKDLLIFRFVCKDCIHLINMKEEIYPIDNGYLLHFIYFLKDEKLYNDAYQFIEYKIYEFFNNNNEKLILFYDEEIINYIKYLTFKMDIYLLNIIYIDMLEYDIEF